MVNEERLRPMVKMAMFDKNEGKRCKPMVEYERQDYVSMELLKSFVAGTLAFALIFGIWALQDMDRMMEMLNAEHLADFIITAAVCYAVFLLVYLIITYAVYQVRYTQGRKEVKEYYVHLKTLNKLYEREEKLRMPSQNK